MPEQLFYIPTRKCSCCGKVKPISEFHRESYTDRISNQCKICVNTKRRVQRDRAKTSKFVAKEKQREMTKDINYSLADWKAAMVHFGGACAFCGKPEGRAKDNKLDRDHLIPVSQGGKTIRSNIIPACRKCNRGRGNRQWELWYRMQDFFSEERYERLVAWINQD